MSVYLHVATFEQRGLNTGKKVNGHKRQFLVDSGGKVYVHAANQADGQAAVQVLKKIQSWGQRLQKIITNSAYEGLLDDVVKK